MLLPSEKAHIFLILGLLSSFGGIPPWIGSEKGCILKRLCVPEDIFILSYFIDSLTGGGILSWKKSLPQISRCCSIVMSFKLMLLRSLNSFWFSSLCMWPVLSFWKLIDSLSSAFWNLSIYDKPCMCLFSWIVLGTWWLFSVWKPQFLSSGKFSIFSSFIPEVVPLDCSSDFLFFLIFIYSYLTVLGLHCCAAFSLRRLLLCGAWP